MRFIKVCNEDLVEFNNEIFYDKLNTAFKDLFQACNVISELKSQGFKQEQKHNACQFKSNNKTIQINVEVKL